MMEARGRGLAARVVAAALVAATLTTLTSPASAAPVVPGDPTAASSSTAAPGAADEPITSLPVEVVDLDGDAAPVTPKAGPSSSALRTAARSRSASSSVVDVHHDGDQGAAEAAVVAAGGRVHGPAGTTAIEATVPNAAIVAIEAAPHVTRVALPTTSADTYVGPGSEQALAGSEVALTNANAWQANGISGAGVKVGIIDSFSTAKWEAAVDAGDIAGLPAGTFCRQNGTSCNVWAGGEHGVGVAEIVHEMAPGATLYLASVRSTADFQAAVDWFATQGVKVITRSQTAEYDGPGNGTGGNADVVARAVSKGMVYLNSAGNSGGGGDRDGSYWRGTWVDQDNDGYLEWGPGDESMLASCWYANGLRWSDWGTGRTDYDLEVYSLSGQLLGRSEDDQSTGAAPIERMNTIDCGEANDVIQLAVRRYAPGSGSAGDVLEFMMNGSGLEYWQNPYAGTAPMADSASPGMLSVGAVDPAAGTQIANYSSQGPSNDGRIKPDVSAPACVASTSYAPECFNGTSAATPVVAGAVALAIAAGVSTTPAGIVSYIKGSVQDRGASGPDNVYGTGQVKLKVGTGAPLASLGAMVDRQFRDFLNRAPNATERTTWIRSLLTKTKTRGDLVAFLRSSTENTTNVDPVTRLYRAYFLRIPDRGGLQYWIGKKRAGTSLGAISQSFVKSPEFVNTYGSLSNRAFVELVYQNVLGRPGEASGVSYWTGRLDAGQATRGVVMSGFSESNEYKVAQAKAVNVSVIVIAMLRRSPTASEYNSLVAGSATSQVVSEWAFTQSYPTT